MNPDHLSGHFHGHFPGHLHGTSRRSFRGESLNGSKKQGMSSLMGALAGFSFAESRADSWAHPWVKFRFCLLCASSYIVWSRRQVLVGSCQVFLPRQHPKQNVLESPKQNFLESGTKKSGPAKGVIAKGVFSHEESLQSPTTKISRRWSDSPMFSTLWGLSKMFWSL